MKAFWSRMRYWPEPRGFWSLRSRMPAGRRATRSIAVLRVESSSVGVRREQSTLAEPLPNGQLEAAGGIVRGGPACGLVDGVGVEGEPPCPQRSARTIARTHALPARDPRNARSPPCPLPATLSRALNVGAGGHGRYPSQRVSAAQPCDRFGLVVEHSEPYDFLLTWRARDSRNMVTRS